MANELDKAIVAYGLKNKRFLMELETAITSDYVHPNIRDLYEIIMEDFSKHHSEPTARTLKGVGKDKYTEELNELFEECSQIAIDEREFNYDLELLKERYNKQVLLSVGRKIFQENWDGEDFKDLEEANKELAQMVSVVDNIKKIQVHKESDLGSWAKKSWEEYKFAKENPEQTRGVLTGIKELDDRINGVGPGELLLVGGESSSGKSALVMNMGINAWLGTNPYPDDPSFDFNNIKDDGANVLFFSLEMKENSLRRRCNACVAGVPSNGIRDGNLNEQEELKLKKALKFMSKYDKKFSIIDIPRGCTMGMLENKFIEKKLDFNPDLVVLDYITLMDSDSNKNEPDWIALGRLAEKIHEFGKYYDIPVISPVQLTREGKGGGPNNIQDRVARSKMLVDNCDILLNIAYRENEDLLSDMQITIGKMRDGQKGSFVLRKQFNIMRITGAIQGFDYVGAYEDGYGS